MQLPSCYLFQNLSAPQIDSLSAITFEEQFQKGKWIFCKDQKADKIYLVKKGAVELLIKVQDSIEIPIAIIRPDNGCVGIGALVEPFRYTLSARCAADSTLLAIKREALQDLMCKDHELGCIMMKNLAQKLLTRLTETRKELKIHFLNLVRSAAF
jgi:CRP-like cAMP-binding protein